MSLTRKYSVAGEIFETSEEAIVAAANLIKVLKPSNAPFRAFKDAPGWYTISGEKQYWDGERLWKKIK